MENITIIGLIVVIALAAAREVFSWFKQKNLQNSEVRLKAVEANLEWVGESAKNMERKLEQLHEWHDVSDQDGVKIWYIRRSLEEVLSRNALATESIARSLEIQAHLLQQVVEVQKDIHSEVKSLDFEMKMTRENVFKQDKT